MVKLTDAELIAAVKICCDLAESTSCDGCPAHEWCEETHTDIMYELERRLSGLRRKLKVARVERDAERAKMTRIVGMAEKEWLGKVHPDWYERLSDLDYDYDPVKDGTPWYRAEDVWACIEEVADV